MASLQTRLMQAWNRVRPPIRLLHPVTRKVSVVIPNYNGRAYLGDCIDSLHRLEFPRQDYEIIVIDNASSDGSCEFLRSEHPDVLLVEAGRNLGFAGGCNRGIEHSSGAYVVLLNNDTRVDTRWLAELVEIADRDGDAAVVGSKLLFKHDPSVIQNAGSYLTDKGDGGDLGAYQPDEGQYDATREMMAVCGASMLIKRSLLEEIGALDEDFFAYYEEIDLCYRARLYGKKVIFAPKSVVHHVHAGTSKEWSPFFTFHVLRNKLFLHLKNSPAGFFLKVLSLYARQMMYDILVAGRNRKIHVKVLASFLKNLPRFLVKRLYVRWVGRSRSDAQVLLRLTKARPRVEAASVKKVCVYNAYLPTMGGGENLTAHFIGYINRIFPTASIDVLCHETEAFDRSRFDGKDFVRMLEQQFGLPIKNTRIRWIDMKFDRRSNLKTIRYLRELSAISREYDLFINNSYSSLVPGRARVNLYSCMFPWVFNRQAGWLKRLARSPLYHRFLSSYEIFLSISQYTQKWVDEYWGVNSFVLYPPVRREKASIPAQKENIVLNIGRFFAGGHNKKQDAMARAFIEMHEHGWTGDWKLVLAGRRHTDEASVRYIRSIEQMAEGYPIEFRYDIGADEMQRLLDQAKIYWHATGYEERPDLNPEKFEHFGLSTIEAALSGAVPVVFHGGGQPEIVDHARNGFLWETTDDLIKYTRLLIEDDRMWKNLSQAAFDSMEIFSDEKQLRWFKLFLSSYYRFDDR